MSGYDQMDLDIIEAITSYLYDEINISTLIASIPTIFTPKNKVKYIISNAIIMSNSNPNNIEDIAVITYNRINNTELWYENGSMFTHWRMGC